MISSVNAVRREHFIGVGCAVFEGVLEAGLVARLRSWSDKILGLQEAEKFRQQRTTGSMVLIDWQMTYEHGVLAELNAHPGAPAELGFA